MNGAWWLTWLVAMVSNSANVLGPRSLCTPTRLAAPMAPGHFDRAELVLQVAVLVGERRGELVFVGAQELQPVQGNDPLHAVGHDRFEVVCHIADFEPIMADRMKRVIALDRP